MRWWLLALAACGRVHFDPGAPRDGASDVTTDAQIDACAFGAWSAPQLLTGPSDPGAGDFGPAISRDGTELYFTSDRAGSLDLYVSQLVSGSFGAPTSLSGLDTPMKDSDCALAAGDTRLYFGSARTGQLLLYVSDRVANTFSTATVISELAGPAGSPTVSDDELEMFFEGSSAIRRATRATTSDVWVDQGEVTELGEGTNPSLSGDRLTLYFETTRTGLQNIDRATRPAVGMPFDPPVREIALEASFTAIGDPDISPDGSAIYFTAQSGGQFDLYVATRACL